LIGPTLIPPRVTTHMQYCRSFFSQHGQSVFQAVIEQEIEAQERVVDKTDHFVTICPFASMSPFELYVLPLATQSHFGLISDNMLADLTPILQSLLSRADEGLGNPDYNLAIHTAPTTEKEHEQFRWYIQFCPRLATTGGFELATDVYINTVDPQTAAAFYRIGCERNSLSGH